jgi:hypothetical protein
MARATLGFVLGLLITVVAAFVLWFVLPFVFAGVAFTADVWLGWFPFAVSIPALLLGGFTAARVARVRRVVLGFVVGLAAAALAALSFRGTGQAYVILIALFSAGVFSAIGAAIAAKQTTVP